MSFKNVMDIVLPNNENRSAHVTGHYGEHRAKGPHGGSDFNYEGGQSGVNLRHPRVHSPISGEVTFVGGQYGTIKVRDAEGNSHEILHTQNQSVVVGQMLQAGEEIGTMGGRGPRGAEQYAQHVHYQLKDSRGISLNPEEFWDQRQAINPRALQSPEVKGLEPVAHRILKYGEYGSEVRQIQDALKTLGYPLKADGDFGFKTKESVLAFQQANGLKADGIVGAQTFDALKKAEQAPLLSNPNHPDHNFYKQALAGVEKLPAHSFRNDQERHNAAASLAVDAKVSGLKQIDHVLLSTHGLGLFAVQGRMDDPAHHRIHVDKAQAAVQPIERSTQQMDEERQNQRQQRQQTIEREPRRMTM